MGLSPFHLLALIVSTALIIAIAGVASGFLFAAAFSPRHFEMPSLLADMGAITPRFNGVVVAVVIVAVLVAVLAGTARTAWILGRGPVARTLGRD